ncbi:glycosyltransferase family 4 protein [Methylophilaceae bacterium]|nr:glycosyltransferase family 4 protein [Methylophilaceae bacterium]
MKLLIFTQHFWPENFRINEVASSMKSRGHSVDVVTAKPNYPEGKFYKGYKAFGINKEVWKGVKVYRLPIVSRGNKSFLRLSLNYLSFIFSSLLFSPLLLRKKKYDIIFVYGVSPIFQVIPASFIGWLKGIPVVLWVQDLWPQSVEATGYIKSHFLLKILEKFVKFSYSHTDLILVQSVKFVDFVSKLSPNVPVKYYPNSVDKNFYSPRKICIPKINSLKSGFSVLFAGNVGKAQSMETIVSAATKLLKFKDIKIVIIGSGSKIKWLEETIKDKNLENIFLEGSYPNEVMPSIMRQASALLVSLSDQPIFALTVPNKVQAYLAVGRPIIASLNGECARIINASRAGFCAPSEDVNGLVNAILKIYHMTPEELLQLGNNGRSYFKNHFDEHILIDNLIKHFECLINKD